MAISIDDIVGDIDELVSLPGVFVRINQMIDDPECPVTEVGKAISQDPGLTVRVLRIANSAMYGLSKEVETVAKAVTVIGMQRLRDLVLATSAVEAFEGIPNKLVTMDNFWMHSIYSGLIAKTLAEEIKLKQSDSLFVAGLLHDIGQLLMFRRIPDLSRQALLHAIEEVEEMDLYLSEREVIGFDHAMVGAELAEHWHLPAMLVETIRYHHEPEKAQKFPKETAIVHIANTLAVLAELHTTEITETDAPVIHQQAWEITGLTDAIIQTVTQSALQQFNEVRSILSPQ